MKELINAYPKATEVIKGFYLEKLLNSMKNNDGIPEDFKMFARQKGIDDQNLTTMMESAPRQMFDVFDAYELYVEIGVVDGEGGFRWRINGSDWSSTYNLRFEAEVVATSKAYELLEKKLNDDAGV